MNAKLSWQQCPKCLEEIFGPAPIFFCTACKTELQHGVVAGKKFDADKTQYHYMPLHSLEQINQVLMHGANKYGAENWRHVEGWEHRYYNAALRHIFAHRQGEKLDPESGKSHLAHAICSLIFLIEKELSK